MVEMGLAFERNLKGIYFARELQEIVEIIKGSLFTGSGA